MSLPKRNEPDVWIRLTPNPTYGYAHTPAITPVKQVTIRCVARWSNRYEFWPVGYPREGRRGVPPANPHERDRELTKLYASVSTWVELSPLAGYELVGVLLYSDDRVILDMHDGDLGYLFLTGAQADELGFACRDTASDLYVPE
jgi:hypothetical protein